MNSIQCAELGFNAGHSSILFLEALPNATVYSFDLGNHMWAVNNSKFLKKIYKDRFHYVKGDSLVTIPKYKKLIMCDVVFADGGKGFDIRYNDVLNFRNISYPGALVFMDEICDPDCGEH